MTEQEQTIPITVSQYADCIMALQKLNDIYKLTLQDIDEDNFCGFILAIRDIAQPSREGTKDGTGR